ncbi:hypothetical protein FOL47_008065 [Perkinsus chesapeaki]|uniref:Delta-aminolevulinic acid dehydratase n=1 Tax=Perkinsus chesapeaki TaxID=330153 RepID=A0A7J6N4T5_PERCH|nr:hypothetical protein FOL47_008065 [Perkinsus chesapeaki]
MHLPLANGNNNKSSNAPASVVELPRNKLHSSLFHPSCREWLEPHLHPSQLIWPVFVTQKVEDKEIPGFRWIATNRRLQRFGYLSPNMQYGRGDKGTYPGLIKKLMELVKKGLKHVMVFGVVEDKDPNGSMADADICPVIECIKSIKSHTELCNICILADVCMCEYTSHGHCGILRIVNGEECIDNKQTVCRLANIALKYAIAGADIVCPSDMMDSRIASIRDILDTSGYEHVQIMAYTSKKASVMYAPFRDAVDSTFKGDRKRYQHPVGSSSIAMRALERDLSEGADLVIVKPSLFYGDIIHQFKESSNIPVVAYIVSGEYKMLYDYGQATGDMNSVVRESHISILRAGATVLITYFTPYILDNLHKW